jgi:hypothetical protein
MKFGINIQKDENNSPKKPRSTVSAVLQTAAFLGGIVVAVGLVLFAVNSKPAKPLIRVEYQQISFYKLSSFEYFTPDPFEKTVEKKVVGNVIPQEILDLNGTKVALSGYMLPYKVDDEGDVSEFSLNGNYDMCYFGAPVALNEWVMVKLNNNLKVKYTHRPIKVFGVLEVGEDNKDGDVTSLYRLNLEKLGDYAK